MKLTDIACGVLLMAAFQICQASDADDLLARTRALKALAADFHEVIEDEDGLELESYDGKLKIKVAGKSFRLDTDGDEGSSVVCDGHDLYSFDRAVSQVSVFSFDKVVQNSPFWLVIDPSPEVLAKFKISKAGAGSFNIKSEDQNVLYNVSFDKDGLSSIRYVDQNRQSVTYTLKNRDFGYAPKDTDFVFTIPEGVTVDDQR